MHPVRVVSSAARRLASDSSVQSALELPFTEVLPLASPSSTPPTRAAWATSSPSLGPLDHVAGERARVRRIGSDEVLPGRQRLVVGAGEQSAPLRPYRWSSAQHGPPSSSTLARATPLGPARSLARSTSDCAASGRLRQNSTRASCVSTSARPSSVISAARALRSRFSVPSRSRRSRERGRSLSSPDRLALRSHVRNGQYAAAMRLIVARCEVAYTGRLTADLPEARGCSCSRPTARCSSTPIPAGTSR